MLTFPVLSTFSCADVVTAASSTLAIIQNVFFIIVGLLFLAIREKGFLLMP
jgi:hypothetical protein